MRNLTALELRRLTGASETLKQIEVLEKMHIPHYPRNPTSFHIVDVTVYTTDVNRYIGQKGWEVIQDENIEQWGKRCEQSEKDRDTGPQGHPGRVESLLGPFAERAQ